MSKRTSWASYNFRSAKFVAIIEGVVRIVGEAQRGCFPLPRCTQHRNKTYLERVPPIIVYLAGEQMVEMRVGGGGSTTTKSLVRAFAVSFTPKTYQNVSKVADRTKGVISLTFVLGVFLSLHDGRVPLAVQYTNTPRTDVSAVRYPSWYVTSQPIYGDGPSWKHPFRATRYKVAHCSLLHRVERAASRGNVDSAYVNPNFR